jgi:hypothetical protein
MIDWLEHQDHVMRAAGGAKLLRRFIPTETPITRKGITPEDGGWRIDFTRPGEVAIFAIDHPEIGARRVLTYRAEMRTANATDKVFLKMNVRVAHEEDRFSQGIHDAAAGETGWACYHATFYLREDQLPTRVEFIVVSVGSGTVWIRNIELLTMPIA